MCNHVNAWKSFLVKAVSWKSLHLKKDKTQSQKILILIDCLSGVHFAGRQVSC